MARREECAYREYASDEQRSQAGCIGVQSGTVIRGRVLSRLTRDSSPESGASSVLRELTTIRPVEEETAARHRSLSLRNLAGLDDLQPKAAPPETVGGARKGRGHHDPIREAQCVRRRRLLRIHLDEGESAERGPLDPVAVHEQQ